MLAAQRGSITSFQRPGAPTAMILIAGWRAFMAATKALCRMA